MKTNKPFCFSPAGKHYIDVFWSGFALPKSPYLGHAVPYQREAEPELLPVHVRATSPVHVRCVTTGF